METIEDYLEHYVLCPRENLQGIENLMKRLYSEKAWDADEMRNWANWLNQRFLKDLEGRTK